VSGCDRRALYVKPVSKNARDGTLYVSPQWVLNSDIKG
jgi:hypothetical protein